MSIKNEVNNQDYAYSISLEQTRRNMFLSNQIFQKRLKDFCNNSDNIIDTEVIIDDDNNHSEMGLPILTMIDRIIGKFL